MAVWVDGSGPEMMVLKHEVEENNVDDCTTAKASPAAPEYQSTPIEANAFDGHSVFLPTSSNNAWQAFAWVFCE